MLNFRQFEVADPFGRTWQVFFKWLQTAISLRHSDSVDVRFVLTSGEIRVEKTIAMPHPELVSLSNRSGHPLTDAWCSRLAAMHLKRLMETGEDIEKDLVTISPDRLAEHAAALGLEEHAEVERRRGAA